MNINNRKAKLIEKLKNKEYRDFYVSSNIDVGVAFQIRALRKQRNYTQDEFAEIANMKQERISSLENPSRTPNISTLKKLANAFDVGLIVRFVSIGELLEWQLNLSPESLEVSSFDIDSYFQEIIEEGDITAGNEQYVVPFPSQATKKVISLQDYRSRTDINSFPQSIIMPMAADMV